MLDGNELWNRLTPDDRAGILADVGLAAPTAVDLSSDTALLTALDARPLSARQADADAVQGRVQRAIAQAAKRLEPRVRPVIIERTTLRSSQDVEQWLERQKAVLLHAIGDGPVLIQ